MNPFKAIELMRKYNECPQCGNDKLGNGEGTLNIDGDDFKRTCKCGWEIEIKGENK